MSDNPLSLVTGGRRLLRLYTAITSAARAIAVRVYDSALSDHSEYRQERSFAKTDVRMGRAWSGAWRNTRRWCTPPPASPYGLKHEIMGPQTSTARAGYWRVAKSEYRSRMIFISSTAVVWRAPSTTRSTRPTHVIGVGPYGESRSQPKKPCGIRERGITVPLCGRKTFIGTARLGFPGAHTTGWSRAPKNSRDRQTAGKTAISSEWTPYLCLAKYPPRRAEEKSEYAFTGRAKYKAWRKTSALCGLRPPTARKSAHAAARSSVLALAELCHLSARFKDSGTAAQDSFSPPRRSKRELGWHADYSTPKPHPQLPMVPGSQT